MSENKRKVAQMEKVIDAEHAQTTEWNSVILDEKVGKYYTTDLSSARRQLSDAELAEMRQPGKGLIVMRLVDAPIPDDNLTTEKKND